MATDRLEDRRVSFLDLFYDLVYVVPISEPAHSYSSHYDVHGFMSMSGVEHFGHRNRPGQLP